MGNITHHHCYSRPTKHFYYCLLSLALACFLSSCRGSVSNTTSPESSVNSTSNERPSPTKISATQSQTTPATISEIQSQPVWLRRLKAVKEISAKTGMGVQIGETIRTGEKALAQIDLKNGLSFRIGSNAVLTLQPDNRLNLSAGEMITWVNPGKQLPTQVITPGGVAGIRGTTIHIKMPKNPRDAIEFFTWEGTMFIQLLKQKEEFQLKAGEIVKIKPGDTDIRKIRLSIRRLSREEWLNRRQKSRLINNFDKPLPTLEKIDQTIPPVKTNSSSNLTPTLKATHSKGD